MSADPTFYFTVEHASRLSGVSVRQLEYWSATRFFGPKREGGGPPLYGFRDLVALKTISLLRNHYRVPLQELRKVGDWLAKRVHSPWSSLRFFVDTKRHRVYTNDPSTGARISARDGQAIVPELVTIEMSDIAEKAREAMIAELKERAPASIGQVARHRRVMGNQAVVAGTRIPTSAIWSLHEDGFSIRKILKEYPSLEERDVEAALRHEREARQRSRAG